MPRTSVIFPILAIVLVLAVLWFGLGRASGKIVIGVIGPLTGTASPYGSAHRNGIKLAVDQLNSAGGINGKLIEGVFVDDANNKIAAAELCRDLIYKNGAVSIIGGITSDNTMNIQRICEKARIPVLTAVSTNPFITRVNFKYSFRCLSDDDIQATKLAQYTTGVMNLRRVAIIHDSNKYGSQGARTYAAVAKSMGQNIVGNEYYEAGAVNFKTQLEKIKATNPDGLLVWGLVHEGALAVRQARELGIDIPIFGSDGIAPSTLLDLAGPAAEGIVLSFPYNPAQGGERGKIFIEAFRKAFGNEPDSFAAHGYDAMMLIAQAIRNSAGDGPSIRDALSRITVYDGVTGRGGFDATGNETRSVELAQVKGGKFVPLSQGGSL